VHFDLPRSVEEYVQGCGRAGRDFHAASCLAFLAASDAPGLRSQIFGATPQMDVLRRFTQRVFGPGTYLAPADPVMYLSLYDLSNEFDVSEMQLKMGLSRLVQVRACM